MEKMSQTSITLTVLGVVIVFIIIIYNRIIALKQAYKQALSDIDIQLKMRYDLIPNLIETVKGYAAHETKLLESVTNARTQAMNSKGIGDRAKAENTLGMAVTNLLAVAENYPNLKASENFVALQHELSDVENKIAAARRFFNNAVAEFNTAIQQFPAVLLAGIFGFNAQVFFEVSEQEKEQITKPVSVKF